MAFDRTLVYGKAGGAAGELRSIINIPAGTTNTTVTYGSWTAGAGIEYGITDSLNSAALALTLM
jgi:opacity protein-like surface antigen